MVPDSAAALGEQWKAASPRQAPLARGQIVLSRRARHPGDGLDLHPGAVADSPAEPSGDLAAVLEQARAQLIRCETGSALRLIERALALACPREPTSVSAPSSAGARVVVRTLGAFEVHVDGAPLATGRKQPTRTLALLKALVALGGKRVTRTTLVDLLWPDVDGDLGQNALEAALHRLRVRIGISEAIPTRDGCLELDRQLVWVDALAFSALPCDADPAAMVEPVFALYRGTFLRDERDAGWALHPRERLRARFVQIVSQAAQALEDAGQPAAAGRLYERALAVDDLACVFHEGLARCLQRQGRDAEARMARTRAARLLAQPA
jgi:DNA-binding SARP family transcriptional activator